MARELFHDRGLQRPFGVEPLCECLWVEEQMPTDFLGPQERQVGLGEAQDTPYGRRTGHGNAVEHDRQSTSLCRSRKTS